MATVEDVPDKFVQCRDLGHNWKPYSVDKLKHYYKRTLICRECGAKKWNYIQFSGSIGPGYYEYPDGYLVRGAELHRAPQRAKLRLRGLGLYR